MAETRPAFTVVVPLYNAERFIAATLDSVQAQTFADYEVVVVDDASTDGGPAIVAGYMARDARVRMVRQENRGLAGARNSGIRNARGRYIALIDADDLWLPEKLALHFRHLEASPGVGLSFAPSLFIDERGAPLGLAQTPRLTGIDAAHVFCRNPVGNGSAAVLRRTALDDVAFTIDAPEGCRVCWFDESFRQSEDIELWTRLAATTAWRIEGIAPALTLYRVNDTGLSANVEKQLATWNRFRDKLASIAPALVASAGRRSKAYQLRYLARRAAMSGQGGLSLKLVLEALATYPAMLKEEPRRSVLTLAFATLAALLPARLFQATKRATFGGLGRRHTVCAPAALMPSRLH